MVSELTLVGCRMGQGPCKHSWKIYDILKKKYAWIFSFFLLENAAIFKFCFSMNLLRHPPRSLDTLLEGTDFTCAKQERWPLLGGRQDWPFTAQVTTQDFPQIL